MFPGDDDDLIWVWLGLLWEMEAHELVGVVVSDAFCYLSSNKDTKIPK